MLKRALVLLVLVATATVAGAEAVGSQKYATAVLPGGFTDSYTVSFWGGAPAAVELKGDGNSNLVLRVFDGNGNLIRSAIDGGFGARVDWTPRWTGQFTIKVENPRGALANCYVFVTN
jgi:hypothetical protein